MFALRTSASASFFPTVSALLVISCGGATLDCGTDERPADGRPDGGADSFGDASLFDPSCTAPATLDPQAATVDELASRLVGTWRRCGPIQRGIPQFESVVITQNKRSVSWAALTAGVPSTDETERGRCVFELPSTVTFFYDNLARSTVVILFENGGSRFRIVQNGFDPSNIVYLRTAL
jgi:hypothetical protein